MRSLLSSGDMLHFRQGVESHLEYMNIERLLPDSYAEHWNTSPEEGRRNGQEMSQQSLHQERPPEGL